VEIAQAGPTPADDIGNAFVVVGAQGVAILPRQNGGGSGASDAVPWWGDATPQGPTSATNSPGPAPSVDPLAAVSGCDTLGFDARRCDAVVARAREGAHPPVRAEEVIAATVTRPIRDTTSAGSFPIASVTFDLVGGGTTTVDVRCGLPAASDRVCNADPQVTLYEGVSHDVPCGATPGDKNHPCATLPPTPRPASVAAAEPLILRVFDVPLDHVGHYDVLVGAASLPDGLLSERSGTLAESRPITWWIDGGVSIVVRPGKPCVGDRCPSIESIYHAPFHGPQPVNVYLVFDVSELDVVGSVLEVRNLVVR
jgi:hypothetical protein